MAFYYAIYIIIFGMEDKMKQMNKTKKIKTSVVLKTIVVLIALSSMLLNTMLGVSKAEYFKTFSKKFDFEANPDLKFEYLVHDSNGVTAENSTDRSVNYTGYTTKTGVYDSSKSFVQEIVIGGNKDDYIPKDGDKPYDINIIEINGSNIEYGGGIAYKVKIPVDETGYYSLNFTTYTLAGLSGNEDEEFYTLQYVYAFGCEVLGHNERQTKNSSGEKVDKGQYWNTVPFEMAYRQFSSDTGRVQYVEDNYTANFLYADSAVLGTSDNVKDSVYQWKSLCPFRAEEVKLSFKVEDKDVQEGYVIWAWDVRGLEGGHNYRIFVENLAIEKTMELDGTNKNRTNDDPYFMFPQTAYVNNNLDTAGTSGKNRFSNGRGTYVTEATENSLGMRAEMLYQNRTTSSQSAGDNPLGIYIPLKNIQFDKTYKVTFDFSIAKQGSNGPDATKVNGYLEEGQKLAADWHKYTLAKEIFNKGTLPIQSYLHSGLTAATTKDAHNTLKKQIKYANKSYQEKPLTKYDEINSFDTINEGASTNVNDTFSVELDHTGENTINRNFFNAVQHVEHNAQTYINWLTFYNTTFSFNIPSEGQVAGFDINDLYWVWEIAATKYTAFYNIRVDNVRIQEVVDYSSAIETNGFKIGNVAIDPQVHLENAGQGRTPDSHYGIGEGGRDINAFANFKGRNSTGQNYQARAHDTQSRYWIKGNIYAPIVDASKFQAKATTNPYKIFLDGWAVVDGGIDKYVYSIDGGITWQDMVFTGNSDTTSGSDSAGILRDAEYGINQHVQQQGVATSGGKNWITFDATDAANCNFNGFKLCADLLKYATQANLEVIIAAVPAVNTKLRCEILRVINFNQISNYVTFPYDFVSDITVKDSAGNETPLNAHRINDTEGHYYYSMAKAEGVGFTKKKTWNLGTGKPSTTTGYARLGTSSYAYEDIRTLWYDMPVKTTLGITGWAMVEGGVDKYVWSADLGKTWNDCSNGGQALTRNLINHDYKEIYYDAKAAYDSNGNKKYDTSLEKNYMFEDTINGNFTGGDANYGTMLKADLSSYVGQVIDVIFAAKPNGSDVYVPVGRCDNVGVYGDPTLDKGEDGRGMGTFYTKIDEVRVDHFKTDMTLAYNDGDYLSQYAWNPALDLDRHSLTYMEPYHVNLSNTRFYNKTVQEVMSGGKIEIEGFTMIEGGVKQYKYSLDGGLTWTIMQTSTQKDYNNITDKDFFDDIAKKVDSTFDLANGDGGGISYRSEESAKLIAILPTLQVGAEENILIVAESNIEDNSGTGSGFLYPVLRMRLKVISPETYDVEYKTMLNVPISKGAFTYVSKEGTSGGAITNAPKASISLPGTYFVEGEPINFTYDYSNSTWTDKNNGQALKIVDSWNITVMVTTETHNSGNRWMTGTIKYRKLQDKGITPLGRSRTVDLNEILYDLDDNYMTYVSGASYYKGDHLPVGTYKVWLFHDEGGIKGNYNFGIDPYQTIAPFLLCEPLTFKVIDKDNPDFSITSYSYAPYTPGVKCTEKTGSYGDYNTKLTIPKTVYTQGEKIYFTTDLDYCARQVLITDATVSNLDQTDAVKYPEATKGITWEYAEHGRTDIGITYEDNALETWTLKPGQYKIYYFMGENVQYAYRGRPFSLGDRHATNCKMYTILDITILPNNGKVKDSAGNDIPIHCTQTVTANYTKIDGTKATKSGHFDVNGQLIETEYKFGKYINTYHLGIDFTKTITDVRPGTEITFSVTNNIPLDPLPSAWKNKISTIVLRETKKKV